MSNPQRESVTLGDVTAESRKRAGSDSEYLERPVYGVDRSVGLTSVAKYTASSFERYKTLDHGMFAYNPMRLNIGSIGYCSDEISPGLVSPDYVVFECDRQRLDPEFLSYYINSPAWKDWTASAGVGSVRMRIYYKELSRLPLPLPSIHEQHAIVDILSILDGKIELDRQMNRTLESIMKAVFNSWFGKYESKNTNDYRKIPNGWNIEKLSSIVSILGGYSFKSQDWMPQGVPVVKIGSVKPGLVDLSQVSYVSDHIAAQAERYRLKTGDLLIGMTGYVGEVGLVPPSATMPLLNQRVGKFLLSQEGTAELGFIYCIARSSEFKSFVLGRSHGTAQSNVSISHILDYPIILPSKDVYSRFNLFCKPLLDKILMNHNEIAILASLRDSLLSKLMRGEVRVKP